MAQLRRFTPARIALGRAGDSLPTAELLNFGLAHAMARDAVHALLDTADMARQLNDAGLTSIEVHSAARDRATYLRRPDLGRRLDDPSRKQLAALRPETKPDLLFIVADGLSAIAPQRYAVPLILDLRAMLPDWDLGPIVIATQARVALGDEAGELLNAGITVMLIGERPGLSSPDSLGAYLTYNPKVGRSDAERNCVSNIHAEGMSIERAARTLKFLLIKSRQLGISGIALKEDSHPNPTIPTGSSADSSAHKRLRLRPTRPRDAQ